MINNILNTQNLYSNMSQTVINRADRLYSSGVNQLKSLQPFFDRLEPKAASCIKLIRRAALPLIQRPVALCAIVGVTIVCVDSFVDSVVRKVLNVRSANSAENEVKSLKFNDKSRNSLRNSFSEVSAENEFKSLTFNDKSRNSLRNSFSEVSEGEDIDKPAETTDVSWVIFSKELSRFVARSGVGFLALKTITVVTGVPLNNEDLFIFLVGVIVLKQLINDCREIKDLAIKLFFVKLELIATKKLANK